MSSRRRRDQTQIIFWCLLILIILICDEVNSQSHQDDQRLNYDGRRRNRLRRQRRRQIIRSLMQSDQPGGLSLYDRFNSPTTWTTTAPVTTWTTAPRTTWTTTPRSTWSTTSPAEFYSSTEEPISNFVDTGDHHQEQQHLQRGPREGQLRLAGGRNEYEVMRNFFPVFLYITASVVE